MRKWELSGGLEVLLCRDTQVPVVAYQSWYRVGSRDEKPGKTGLAHLFEHLMFNESENVPAGEFDRRIEAVGGDTNAATWVDWTYYQTSVGRDHLPLVIELEANRLGRLVLREPQVTSELEVVANERRYRVEDDVDGFLNERLYEIAFEKHPYHWPTIGWMEDIKGFTPQDCTDFYRRFYVPSNVTLVVVGDFEEKQILEEIDRHYGKLPSRKVEPPSIAQEGEQNGERRATFKKPTATDKLYYGYRCPPMSSDDHPPLEVLMEVLFGGLSSRLWKRLVIGEIASSTAGWVAAFRDPGLLEIHTMMKRDHGYAEAEEIITEELDLLHEKLVSEDELEKARLRLESSFLWGLRTANGRAQALGHYEVTAGDFRRLMQVADAYQKVTPADVQRTARKYLRTEKRCVVAAVPDEESA